MTTFHIAAKLDTIEMPILLIQPLPTYFICSKLWSSCSHFVYLESMDPIWYRKKSEKSHWFSAPKEN